MFQPENFASALDTSMGFELLEASAEKVVGRYPVKGNTQPMGLWHGGASAVAVEALGSIGACAHGITFGLVGVGVDLNVTHHRPVTSGWVTGEATPLHLGRRTSTWQVLLYDDDRNHIATGRLTCQLIPAPDQPAD